MAWSVLTTSVHRTINRVSHLLIPANPHDRRTIVLVFIAAAILLRTAVFAVWPQAYFDSDQAIFGLMAKHLSELRGLPLYMYGQNYILAVEAWMAAPLFKLAGPSVFMLKLPLVVINVVVGLLLASLLIKEVKLSPTLALVASLLFVLVPPGTASHFVEASGGNLEPFLYVLLLWVTRDRPLTFGAILAIGFLHREFTLYGLGALLALEAADRSLFTRANLENKLRALVSFAAVWQIVQVLRLYSAPAGPTAGQWLPGPSSNVQELAERFCWNPTQAVAALPALFTDYLAILFGAKRQAVVEFGVNTTIDQGANGLWLLLGGALLFALARACLKAATSGVRPWRGDLRFCSYLFLIGLQSTLIYVGGRCGQLSIFTMRYTLLSLLGGVGIAACSLRIETSRVLRGLTIAAIACWAVVGGVAHVRLLDEYIRHPPRDGRGTLATYLVSNGIRYGWADYWIAYHVTFLSAEKVIVAATDRPRILDYEWAVQAHAKEAVTISRKPCFGGVEVTQGLYVCRP